MHNAKEWVTSGGFLAVVTDGTDGPRRVLCACTLVSLSGLLFSVILLAHTCSLGYPIA